MVPCCHLLRVSFPSYEEVCVFVHVVVSSSISELDSFRVFPVNFVFLQQRYVED